MTATISQSSHFVDVATQTDAHSFTITRLLVDTAVMTGDPEVSSIQVDAGWKTLDGIPCIMGGLTALVASVGGTLRGRTQTEFPWKTLPKELARLGCCLVNYPNETLMPGETRPTLSRSKGVHDLTLPHRINLVNALKMGTLTIRAVTNDAARTRLMMSTDPVIIGEAPSHRSIYSRGRRAFANGDIDCKGPRRLASPPSTPPTSTPPTRTSTPPARPSTPPARPSTPPARPSTRAARPSTCAARPATSPTHRHVQVFVEISRPPPRPASRAVSKVIPPSTTHTISRLPPWPASRAASKAITPSIAHTTDLIPPIAAVERSASSSEYVDDETLDEESDASESDHRPAKRLRRYNSK
ncbi:uncharacterized protein F5891DRAFT_988558 [Suillus fuscotomentosus]|uniref:Uncharacterized protein n=1 Tax=Suillus fuscotomentosus TaxID=1912939 RepID=A0AAD4DNG8_9AGAM|nr:uncharacterized protein F5891DRAFT_989044 [Suillus fuscotomentosus]XP_041216758.1 uncharacterized protein F5891DRAFT_988558 [Suillus fuscotomentosus]KAG1886389.1 hypothetical protein F5891DRAFT_989044 [Suillus fuscotomentosus]KAG1886917.1 hypothetical protein F5891DRAFT_988558 [Suillus fuscotomentosus]